MTTWRLTYGWSGGRQPLSDVSLARALRGWSDDTGPAVLAELKDRTPVYRAPLADPDPRPGGAMRDSETLDTAFGDRAVTMKFAAHRPYAKYVVPGTAPHEIAAVRARMLHYYTDTEEKFRRSVWHPGTKPNPFPDEVMRDMRDEIIANLREHITAELAGG